MKEIQALKWNESLVLGHYLVSGIPGSGKSQLLIYRAIYLKHKYPHRKHYLLVKYKESKQSLISRLTIENMSSCENLQVMTFYEFALMIANVVGVEENGNEHWYDTLLPLIALKKVTPFCHSILIDDYEQFKDDWIRLCLESLIGYESIKKDGKKVILKDIILFGDVLQATHKLECLAWSHLGLNMRGRSDFLSVSFRNDWIRSTVALKFMELTPCLRNDVKKYYSMKKKSDLKHTHSFGKGSLHFLQDTNDIIQRLTHLQGRYGLDEEILILSLHGGETYLNRTAKPLKSLNQQRPKIIILVQMQQFDLEKDSVISRTLFYQALTRSSDAVYCHAEQTNLESYASQLKQCYEAVIKIAL